MLETSEITRRWSGYICPDCRFVFRVPKDHDGVGLVCPSCRRLLKLPAAGEPLPQLVTAAFEETASPASHEEEPPQGERRKRRRRAKDKPSDAPSWEQGSRTRSKRPEKILMASMILGAALLVLVAFLVSRHPSPVVAPPPVSTVVKDANDAPLAIVAPATNELDLGEFMRVAEPLAKTFLEAQTLTDLLAVVRHPQLTRQRFIARFHDENLQPLGLQTFAEDGAVRIDQSSATVKIRTGNFEQRDLSFAHTKAGWKIDWESWVGWCDVPWDEFNEKALTTPNRFRVHLKPITYYNFSFSDDRKWRSYLIESPDGEHRFFGYVERGSPLDDRINFADNSTDQDFILDLCFPSDHSGQNQLLISDLIAEGWIEPEPTDSP